MVTATVRMLDRVHSDTTNLRPRVSLSLVLEVGSSSLEHGLVDSSSSGDDSDHRSIAGRNRLLRTRWQLYLRFVLIGVMGDDGGVVARCSGEFAAISQLLLELADDGSLWHGTDGHDVTDGQRRLLSTIDKLTSVHAFDGDERLLALLKLVWISEFDDGQRRASAWVVNDILYHSFDVSVTLGIIGGPQSSGSFAMFVVGRENGSRSLTILTN